MTTIKKEDIIRPGKIPAIKSLPIDCCVRIPKTMRVMLGGRRTPSVPTVATIPVESFLLYPYRSISGIATLAKVAEVATTDPQIALNTVAPITVATASPPGMCPRNLWFASYKLFAMPALNAICPMRTKRGIAVKAVRRQGIKKIIRQER